MVIIYLFPCLGLIVATALRPKNSCCVSWNPASPGFRPKLAALEQQSLCLEPISFCFRTSLLKKALLPGPRAPAQFIIVTPFIIAIRRARKGCPCRLCEMAPFI